MGGGDVACNLRTKFVGAAEFLFFTNTFPETKFHAPWCTFPVEIEQVRFDTERRAVKGRAHANIGDGTIALRFAVKTAARDVNPAGGEYFLVRREIHSGEGEE